MEINQELIKLLKENKSEVDTSLLYLLAVYHNLKTDIIPEETIRKVNSLGIVQRDYKHNTVEWHISLYDGQNTDSVWEWVNEYRKLFASKNKEREGNKKTCIQRMKVFFQQNPHIRKEDVLEATTMYLRTVEPQFVKTSERFIFDGAGTFRTSMLLTWCEKVIEKREKNKTDSNNKMMK